MKFSLKSLVVIAVTALPFAAQAHKAFLLPSTTVLTESDHKITVDAAVSNDLFYFNHVPMRLDDLQITRSEEHTSELQSLMRISYAVFCLTKKIPTKITNRQITITPRISSHTTKRE